VTLHGLALRQARRLWPDLAGLRKVKKLKFKRIIHPRQVAQLRLARWPGSEQVDFELTCLGKSCASGSLVFEPSSVGTRVNCW
jgi:hypothetical protein